MLLDKVAILIVDDVNAMRVHMRDLLREAGFNRVNVAHNGPVAKQMMEAEKYDLILADWLMEPTDGLDLLKYCRSHPDYKTAGFIMITGESTKPKVMEAIQAGVDDYLVKPVTATQIKTKVFDLLLRKGLI